MNLNKEVKKILKKTKTKNMKTAIQEIILKMRDAKDNFPNIGFDEEFIRGFNKAFQMAIFISEKIGLEKEKEQIKDAFNCGIANGADDSEQYFEETFKS